MTVVGSVCDGGRDLCDGGRYLCVTVVGICV